MTRAQNIRGRQTALEPTNQRCMVQLQAFRPLAERESLSVMREQVQTLPRVSSLLRGCGPTAVTGSVRPVIVDAINAHLRGRPRSHITVKRLEVASPLVAHGYSAPAVVLPIRAIRVLASIDDASPDAVLDGMSHAVSDLGDTEPRKVLSFYAPARRGSAGSKVAAKSCNGAAAIALAYPTRPFVTQDKKAAEALTVQVEVESRRHMDILH